MDVILTIGESDPFRENNECLSRILHGKGVPHQLHIWQDRAHSGRYWRRMARIYI
jgi:esterase/lipase superfamily enzyme